MQIKKAAIVANGMIHQPELIKKRILSFPYVIAADGGLANCHRMNIVPNLIVGDMDSAHPDLLKQYPSVPIHRHPVDKDKTDLEIALEDAISAGAEHVVVFSALERRADHSFYNLSLLYRYPSIVSIESEFETIFVIDKPMKVECAAGTTVSLLPLGTPAENVTSKGLKWELKNTTLNLDFMSISNICISNGFFIDSITNSLLCCLCK